MPTSLFDGFITFGRQVMHNAEQGDPEAVRYKRLLGEISALFLDTHSMVTRTLDRIAKAGTAQEARALVLELRGEALSAAFRAQGLCDTFVGFGNALFDLTLSHGPPAFATDDPRMFAARLQDREQEVAFTYGNELQELGRLVHTSSGSADLQTIQARGAAAKAELTSQIADFRVLAERLRRLDLR